MKNKRNNKIKPDELLKILIDMLKRQEKTAALTRRTIISIFQKRLKEIKTHDTKN